MDRKSVPLSTMMSFLKSSTSSRYHANIELMSKWHRCPITDAIRTLVDPEPWFVLLTFDTSLISCHCRYPCIIGYATWWPLLGLLAWYPINLVEYLQLTCRLYLLVTNLQATLPLKMIGYRHGRPNVVTEETNPVVKGFMNRKIYFLQNNLPMIELAHTMTA